MMTAENTIRRLSTARIVALAWFALLSLFLVIDHVALTHVAHDVKINANDAQIASAQEKLADLERRLADIEQKPASMSQSAFATVRKTLEDRLTHVDQTASGNARTDDLTPLANRLSAVETRLVKLRPSANVSATAPMASSALEPPFSVLGIELRGGERVLAIAPLGSRVLAQARLLRVGDTEDHWHLDTLTATAAQFRVDGRSQRIEVP